MKHNSLSKIASAGVLTLSLALLPSLPSYAQTTTSPTTTPTVESTGPVLDTTPFQETRDDNNNWGWLGLLGLLGLLNLFRKPKAPTVYRDPADPGNTTRY